MAVAAVRQLKATRPAIWIEGQQRPALALGLSLLEIAENTDGLYRCELEVGNWGATSGGVGHLYFDRQLLDFGKSLEVKLGQDTLFQGRISALEARFPEGAPPTLRVLAEDRFQELRMTRRTRSFDQISDSALFNQLASDHGLTPDVQVNGPTHKVLVQVNQSDLCLLRERARALGIEVWIRDRTLHAAPRTNQSGNPLRLDYGAKLRRLQVTADLAQQCTKVTVSGWDVSAKSAITADADDSSVSSELGATQGGGSILSQAFSARPETLVHGVPHTTDEAQALATAAFRTQARRFVVARGVAETEAALRVGASVELGGVGPLFGGSYYVSEVRHLFEPSGGLRSEFCAERPGLGRP